MEPNFFAKIFMVCILATTIYSVQSFLHKILLLALQKVAEEVTSFVLTIYSMYHTCGSSLESKLIVEIHVEGRALTQPQSAEFSGLSVKDLMTPSSSGISSGKEMRTSFGSAPSPEKISCGSLLMRHQFCSHWYIICFFSLCLCMSLAHSYQPSAYLTIYTYIRRSFVAILLSMAHNQTSFTLSHNSPL